MAVQPTKEFRPSRRESYYLHTRLTGYIKKLENMYTTIDLRNESCVTGKINNVDGFMNIDLTDAVLYDNRGQEFPFESFFIKARNIRYVHIPLEIPIVDLIKPPEKLVKTKQPQKRTWKVSRSVKYQQQILQELAEKEIKEEQD